ncbi:hypothetical protein LSAT2_030488 [Lamellibrachia satsuma]|nr:hypothetical protein LSAT2_030488 [Lamellibrachia satsuma]
MSSVVITFSNRAVDLPFPRVEVSPCAADASISIVNAVKVHSDKSSRLPTARTGAILTCLRLAYIGHKRRGRQRRDANCHNYLGALQISSVRQSGES